MRGQASSPGDTRVSPNGYHYTRTEEKWRLTHHLVAEKLLGRPLTENDLVKFKDKDRTNLSPENIEVVPKGKSSLRRRLAQLEARRDEIDAEIAHVKDQISKGE